MRPIRGKNRQERNEQRKRNQQRNCGHDAPICWARRSCRLMFPHDRALTLRPHDRCEVACARDSNTFRLLDRFYAVLAARAFGADGAQEAHSTNEGVRRVSAALLVEEEVGARLGEREVLL